MTVSSKILLGLKSINDFSARLKLLQIGRQ
jgi:hypothetical protein